MTNLPHPEAVFRYFAELAAIPHGSGHTEGIRQWALDTAKRLKAEAYADAAVKYGIPRTLAYKLVSQMMLGSAKLQLQSGSHPGVLKDAVCSPKGTTIRGVEALEKAGLRAACMESIDTIMEFKQQ